MCEHSFERTDTPPDSTKPWYRCTACSTFAFRRTLGRQSVRYVPYQCGHPGCGKSATERLPGRGPRASFLWRCGEHAKPAAT